jgi:hypothetical protein
MTRRLGRRGLLAIAGRASFQLFQSVQNASRAADLQLATFPSRDGIGAHVEFGCQACLRQAEGPSSYAQLCG